VGDSRPRARNASPRPPQDIDDGLPRAARQRRADRALDTAILKPQSTELGGFILIQGTQQQIDALRRDAGFESWLTHVQLVADQVGIVDAWVNDGLTEAIGLYEVALRKAGITS
jgi:hypothetical protein